MPLVTMVKLEGMAREGGVAAADLMPSWYDQLAADGDELIIPQAFSGRYVVAV